MINFCWSLASGYTDLGSGERRESIGIINLPVRIADKNVFLATEIILEDIPPLLGNNNLMSWDMELYFKRGRALVMKKEVDMTLTPSNHCTIKMEAQVLSKA